MFEYGSRRQSDVAGPSYFAGASRKSGEGAVYKRVLNTTHPLLGSQIKDVSISDGFPDVYDGQCVFFPTFERDATGATLSEGEMSLGDTPGSCDYLIETPINRKPLFGSGTLFGLDLNLFHDNINFNFQKSLPDIEPHIKFESPLVSTRAAPKVPCLPNSDLNL